MCGSRRATPPSANLTGPPPSSAVKPRSPEEIAARIGSTIASAQVRAPYAHEERAARIVAEPADAREVAELVRACETDGISLAAMGAARTLGEIRKTPVALGVSLNRMRRVIAYEPADMTVTVEGGVSVDELNRTMEPSGQRLPVDPQRPDLTCIGSLIAASHAGPLRLSEGTSRDLLIGIRYAGRGGKIVHGGGRVVKNVAGYDLMKVLGSSFGTLGIIVEATFKVRPVPEHYAMALARYDDAERTFEAARALNDLPLAHLEVLSPAAAESCGFDGKYVLLAGLSGSRSEVASQYAAAARMAPGARLIEKEDARAAYACLRDFDFLSQSLAARAAVAPAELASAMLAADAEFVAHAGSGVAELFLNRMPADVRATVARWREIARGRRGHLRVIHCDPEVRPSIELFDLPNSGAMGLMRRLKTAFDPAGIFNPGCFVGEI